MEGDSLTALDANELLAPLTFTATTAGSTVAMTAVLNPPQVSLEYSVDSGVSWIPFTIGSTVINLDSGDSVSFRAGVGGNNCMGTAYSYNTFVISGTVSASGSVDSLLTQDAAAYTAGVQMTAYCYRFLFKGCTGLVSAPALPSTELAEGCYRGMFQDCTSLVDSPYLPATNTVDPPAKWAYEDMFRGCSSLSHVSARLSSTANLATVNWLYGVAPSGTIELPLGCAISRDSASGVPAGWTAVTSGTFVHEEGCLTFTALAGGATVKFSCARYPSLLCSTDGENWLSLSRNNVITLPTPGSFLQVAARTRASGLASLGDYPWASFSITGAVNVSGNVNSLCNPNHSEETDLRAAGLYQALFSGCANISIDSLLLPSTGLTADCYAGMFSRCMSLTTAPQLPATVLAPGCYEHMFSDCTSLTTAPQLPATVLAPNCYAGMFSRCTSLTTAPQLPATVLAPGCYELMFSRCTSLKAVTGLPAVVMAEKCYASMFSECVSLTTPPSLNATSLASGCYEYMFSGSGLEIAPTLPATTLFPSCYKDMFSYCDFLAEAPVLPARELASSCYFSMFAGCSALAAPPELPAAVLAPYCYSYMFSWCTYLTVRPDLLPATVLAEGCYDSMFSRCTSLTTAPQLPATVLAPNCYAGMFSDCTSLTTAPQLPATVLAPGCYYSMFSDCTSLTTAPQLPATVLDPGCYYSMFSRCTSLTTAPQLPATVLAPNCYEHMFSWCSSLTTAPSLPATVLAPNCYASMFYACSALLGVAAGFRSWDIPGHDPVEAPTRDWLVGVPSTGDFHFCHGLPEIRDDSHIPLGWTMLCDVCDILYSGDPPGYYACVAECTCCDPAREAECTAAGGTWNQADCTCSCACGDKDISTACFNSGGIWSGNTCQCMCSEPTHQAGCRCECCDGGDLRSKCAEIGGMFDPYKCQCYGYAVS